MDDVQGVVSYDAEYRAVPRMISVEVDYVGGRVKMLGELTPVKGLCIAPNYTWLADNKPTWHGWILVHISTGRLVYPFSVPDPQHLRDLAARIAEVADDWTEFFRDSYTWSPTVCTQVRTLMGLEVRDE